MSKTLSQGTFATILVAVLAVLSSCGDEAVSTLEIRPRASLTDSAELMGIELEITGQVIRAEDFHPDEAGLLEKKIRVPNSGQLTIVARLYQDGELVAEGELGWTLDENWEWGLDVFRGPTDPLGNCIGCYGSVAIPIASWAQGQEGESLWFAWGGTPRDSGIVS